VSELKDLFKRVFGSPGSADLSHAVPMDPFFMSYSPLVNGWRRYRNPLTGREFWGNREGKVRRNPPEVDQ